MPLPMTRLRMYTLLSPILTCTACCTQVGISPSPPRHRAPTTVSVDGPLPPVASALDGPVDATAGVDEAQQDATSPDTRFIVLAVPAADLTHEQPQQHKEIAGLEVQIKAISWRNVNVVTIPAKTPVLVQGDCPGRSVIIVREIRPTDPSRLDVARPNCYSTPVPRLGSYSWRFCTMDRRLRLKVNGFLIGAPLADGVEVVPRTCPMQIIRKTIRWR
jgi:hypothetical protein